MVIPAGVRGLQGVQGIQGEKGETGPANTLTIGTVEKGENASASITGVSPNQTLNLVLPKGDKGNPGESGPANTLTIGNVQGGDVAQASITGASPNQTLNLILPKGDKGDPGDNFVSVLTGTEENPIKIGDLEPGIYLISGYIRASDSQWDVYEWGNNIYTNVYFKNFDSSRKFINGGGEVFAYNQNDQDQWEYDEDYDHVADYIVEDREMGYMINDEKLRGVSYSYETFDSLNSAGFVTQGTLLSYLDGVNNLNHFYNKTYIDEKIGDIETILEEKVTDSYSASTTDSYSANYVNKLSNYSTEETVCGRWIDGKPIYRIVASINLQDYASWTNLVHISNLKRVINIYGSLNNVNIPRYESSSYFTQFLYENNYIKVMCNGNTGSGYLVIEYTKTTD